MKLIIQTSSGRYGLAIIDRNGHIVEAREDINTPAAERDLGNLFLYLMRLTKLDRSEIKEVVVDLGPGGLSSTRCGVSFANALAFPNKARLYGVSALELVMLEARKVCESPLLCVRSAPGGQVYWAGYTGKKGVAFGCSPLIDAVRQFSRTCGHIAITGALNRINAELSCFDGVERYDIPLPSLDCFKGATLIPAHLRGLIQVLEPITSAEGLCHERA